MKLYMRYPDFKAKAFTLSYDDGAPADKKMIEVLDRYGIKCTFNIESGKITEDKYDYIRELYKNHEIAVHTATHPILDNLASSEVVEEIMRDRVLFEKITGKIVDGMAYPFGLSNPQREPEIAKICGIAYARTVNSTGGFGLPFDFLRWNPTCHHDSPNIDSFMDQFLVPVDPKCGYTKAKLFYLWGHSFEFDRNKNWDHLEHICKKMSGNDEIWYATNGEIQRYIAAFRSLRKSFDGHIVHNPTDVEIYAWTPEKGNVIIKAGETAKF